MQGQEPGTPKIAWTTGEILEATGGRLLSGDIRRGFTGISTDSRRIGPHELFVAIRGEVHDGHAFAAEVVGRGGWGILIAAERAGALPVAGWAEKGAVCVAVPDTTRALGALAAFHRRRMGASVVAVTGSNGKTTTRQMAFCVVSRSFPALTSEKNFNNEIGLPLSLLRLKPEHRWAVVELGMNHPGEIGRLAEICSPDVGVITNIGPAHLEGVSSLSGVAAAKGELIEKMGQRGTSVLNADDPRVLELSRTARNRVVLYGASGSAQVRGTSVKAEREATSFILEIPSGSIDVALSVPGAFMVQNALAAAAVGWVLGLCPSEIKAGLEAFRPVTGRMAVIRTKRNICIIDDCYNANPASMEAALKTLASLRGDNRAVFVAGDMRELGPGAEGYHRSLGVRAAESGISRLYIVGELSGHTASGAREAGMPSTDVVVGTKAQVLEDLKGWLSPGDWVLIKGSRAMGMESIVQQLREWAGEAEVRDQRSEVRSRKSEVSSQSKIKNRKSKIENRK